MSTPTAELVVRATANERGVVHVAVAIEGDVWPGLLGVMLGAVVGTTARTVENLDELGIKCDPDDMDKVNHGYDQAARGFRLSEPVSGYARVLDLGRQPSNPYPDTGMIIMPSGS